MDRTTTWTVAQLAEYLQVHEETVRRWIRAGELRVLNVGSRERPDYRIEPGVALDWIRSRPPHPAEEP